MRLTPQNKQKVRLRILDSATRLFRRHGYDGVNIDRLMAGAKLTRGAFYAHFSSKADLFCAVVAHRHPLLQMLRARSGHSAAELFDDMLKIFKDYLAPAHLPVVWRGCTLASLTGQVARSSRPVKNAYDEVWNSICREMLRGQGDDISPARVQTALMIAVGALNVAAAAGDEKQSARILGLAWQAFCDQIRKGEAP